MTLIKLHKSLVIDCLKSLKIPSPLECDAANFTKCVYPSLNRAVHILMAMIVPTDVLICYNYCQMRRLLIIRST